MTRTDFVQHWSQRAADYRAGMETPYHRDRLRMVDELLCDDDLTGRVLDFGCGDGVHAERVCRQGGQVVGIDIDPSMIRHARARLAGQPGAEALVCGGLEALPRLAEASFDTILAINVLAYLEPAESRRFLAEAGRLLRRGGVLVCTHSNELFDLFTLNSYTVRFFARHFADFMPGLDVAPLLTHPDRPSRTVFPTRANPLNYRFELAPHGLREVRQAFAIAHPAPPLLTAGFDPDDLATRHIPDASRVPEEARWKLAFMCSIFGVRAVRE